MRNGLFVTGTDTNVGKTVASALLCTALNGVYWKPIQTGASEGTDRAAVITYGELPDDRTLPEVYCFDAPLSPHLAAVRAGAVIDLAKIVLPEVPRADTVLPEGLETNRPLIVEGAGGVFVPVNETEFMLDVMRRLALPVLVVSRTALGTINHTLMTLHTLRNYGLTVLGVVMVGESNHENRRAIEEYGKAPVIGHIPRLQTIDRQGLLQVFEREFDKRYFCS
jgi:dethiobiotin synthetase